MGFAQLFTLQWMFFTKIGARNTVPSSSPRRMPLGLGVRCVRLYSFMRAALLVMVAHFTPTPSRLIAAAAS